MKLRKQKWRTAPLGEICKLEYGNNLTDKMRKGGSVPVYGSAGVVGWHDKPLTNSPTLIVGRKGSVGNVFYSEIPCFPIDTTYYVEETVCKENLRWLELFLSNFNLRQLNMATAVPGLNRNIAHLIQIPLPPLEEQKQIAALFQSIETAMEQVDDQEKNLKELQKTLVNGLVNTEPIFGNLLNSKNCTPTNMGAIAECDKKYPEHEKEVERFVGLENIEPENFQLQGFGFVANGTTFTKRFAKDDVLFGKRRAYLKKVAVADFDGICSGDILVIRAKANKILQDLLPYYISAEAFINHAVSTSAGSLSPRTKWKDLETFEIAIPDLKTEEKILEVLQQFDRTIKQLKKQKVTLKLLKQKLLNEILE
ncbi:MAG: restriction endonuclease subunit S [Sediminibacterium sp.]|uniref:restriction endonuclease subunit S n=1 Tax=Sediminibacterium sp. TaxID=1917865 RepID=UPI002AB8C981|nr:restriction endonuclease subunit S [Sediminibacterium sp.]MDZ4070818.1 restriction endonuclease subunit S [Sediminibacterium sp.]